MAIIQLRPEDVQDVLPPDILEELRTNRDHESVYHEGTRIMKVAYSGSVGGDFGHTEYQVFIEDPDTDLPNWLKGVPHRVSLNQVSLYSNLGIDLSIRSFPRKTRLECGGDDLKLVQEVYRFFQNFAQKNAIPTNR